ncbi:Thioredoxin reductase [Fulvivirga imtechensis AK7]|uniref:Thioredoxin reductase n=1 Tax=Fulvivirga imtechensis AK7 TaxID=1237149 RepID=L8JXF7_9BACT|nr:response regulator [Fulvivirga imtechensis]ELR72868.1 Thioredoxin reductase [Fulvivirga imtechensis AK7]
MKKPIIFVLDDDTSVLRAVVRDLREAYKKEYRILATESAQDALVSVKELKNKGETIALFLCDQRMPEMLGVEFLEEAKQIYPEAKRILLTAYSDTEAAIRAINEVQLDYYLMKPWDPPEERLYPVITDHLDEWQSAYRPEFQGIKIVGYQWSPRSHMVKDFLSGNLIPYQWLDMETNEKAEPLIKFNGLDSKDLPVVIFEDGSVLKNPDLPAVGEKMGMQGIAQQKMYDVTIIGAGPAGLAAAVYGGSEGLNTLLIEKRAPGGQAGTSSRIENYLGFPKGLSGAELSRRAITQATRFGIEFLSPQEVVDISLKDNYKIVKLANGNEINTKSIIITTGVDYRQLEAEGVNDFTGAGIYYGAATTEANACKDEEVYVVGGGNSAGQAAMYLSNFARRVYMLIRKPDLKSSMSQYLIDQIAATENIEVTGHTEVVRAHGTDRLKELTLKDVKTGEERTVPAGALLIFIGAKPITAWLGLNIVKDEKGFIETGNSLHKYETFKKSWKLDREPFLLETCSPGIFAAGDVRAGAMNRVASAVGEGAMAIKFIHEYLAEI